MNCRNPCRNPPHTELIDTLWNVNTINTGLSKIDKLELIDTLWNVNAC